MTRASRRQSTAAATRSSRGRAATRLSPEAWRRAWAIVGWILTLALVVWGAMKLDSSVRSGQSGGECKLEWTGLPPWLTEPSYAGVLQQIIATADLRPDDDLQDPSLCARIAANLKRCPWVAEVQQVTRQPNGTIRAAATFREPFAYLEVKGIAYLVDKDGIRLPSKTDMASNKSNSGADDVWERWWRITGAPGSVPDEGSAWTGEDVTAGLKLINFLNHAAARGEVPFRPALRSVDVANFTHPETGYGGLRIRSIEPHGWIQWGLPPGEEYSVEPNATRKLDLLRTYYSEQGGRFPDGWIYDVRDDRGDRLKRWEHKGS